MTKKGTTFRTSKGVVVSVDYPDIYVAPSIIPTDLRLISIFVNNGLNQAITVQLKANRVNSSTGGVNMGAPFQVGASGTDARSLSVETSGWLPYVYVEVQCTVAPVSGSLTVYRIRSKDEQEKLVDALAIRNTVLSTPATDPDKVLIQEW